MNQLQQQIKEVTARVKLSISLAKKFHKDNKKFYSSFSKTCTCKKKLTINDVELIGKNALGLWWTCNNCGTSGAIKNVQPLQVAKRKTLKKIM